MRRISILAVITAMATCIGFETATAGLVGMPLNLRTTIDRINLEAASVDSCLGYTDDVFIGRVPIRVC
jgi:hypothetical protein